MNLESLSKEAATLAGANWRVEDVIDFGNPFAKCIAVRPVKTWSRAVVKMQSAKLRHKLGAAFFLVAQCNLISSGGVLVELKEGTR